MFWSLPPCCLNFSINWCEHTILIIGTNFIAQGYIALFFVILCDNFFQIKTTLHTETVCLDTHKEQSQEKHIKSLSMLCTQYTCAVNSGQF